METVSLPVFSRTSYAFESNEVKECFLSSIPNVVLHNNLIPERLEIHSIPRGHNVIHSIRFSEKTFSGIRSLKIINTKLVDEVSYSVVLFEYKRSEVIKSGNLNVENGKATFILDLPILGLQFCGNLEVEVRYDPETKLENRDVEFIGWSVLRHELRKPLITLEELPFEINGKQFIRGKDGLIRPVKVFELDFLKGIQSEKPSLISLVIRPNENITLLHKMLSEEYETATAIGVSMTREFILSAIGNTRDALRVYTKIPENGLAIFSGTIYSIGAVRTARNSRRIGPKADSRENGIRVFKVYEPKKQITTSLYMCDTVFHIPDCLETN